VFLGRDVELRNRNLIQLGNGVTIGRGVVIDGLSRRGVVLGDRVVIGAYTIIEGTGVVTDLGEGCTIGSGSALGPFSFIGAAGGVSIGENVLMGNRVSFHSENHCFDDVDRPIHEQGVTRQGIVIGNGCWVGANVTFLDGASVGCGAVIGAGSVVRGVIPPEVVAAGVPARSIRLRGSR
jgi:acetyltransferase-like isoleucine patch superfamily enzyme